MKGGQGQVDITTLNGNKVARKHLLENKVDQDS